MESIQNSPFVIISLQLPYSILYFLKCILREDNEEALESKWPN